MIKTHKVDIRLGMIGPHVATGMIHHGNGGQMVVAMMEGTSKRTSRGKRKGLRLLSARRGWPTSKLFQGGSMSTISTTSRDRYTTSFQLACAATVKHLILDAHVKAEVSRMQKEN